MHKTRSKKKGPARAPTPLGKVVECQKSVLLLGGESKRFTAFRVMLDGSANT